MREVFVIQEKDLQDGETIILGVADSMDNVDVMLKKYYGDYTEDSPFEDILGFGALWIKRIKVDSYKFDVTILGFTINEI